MDNSDTSWWENTLEKAGEAFGKGFVKVIAAGATAVLGLGVSAYVSNRSAVHESNADQAWVQTNLYLKTERITLLESNLNELRDEVNLLERFSAYEKNNHSVAGNFFAPPFVVLLSSSTN